MVKHVFNDSRFECGLLKGQGLGRTQQEYEVVRPRMMPQRVRLHVDGYDSPVWGAFREQTCEGTVAASDIE